MPGSTFRIFNLLVGRFGVIQSICTFEDYLEFGVTLKVS